MHERISMKHLTIRDIPQELAEALAKEKLRRGKSLNQTVIQLLEQSLGVRSGAPRSNGMRLLAGTWTPEEHRRFEEAIALTEQVDEELWR